MFLKVVCGLLFLFSASVVAADKKKAQDKPPEIDLLEGRVRRQTGNILVDGKVQNCGEKPIKNLVIFFHFYDADRHLITTRKGGIDEEVLAPGEDSEFHAQVEEPPRATFYKIEFEDGGGRYLRPAKALDIVPIE